MALRTFRSCCRLPSAGLNALQHWLPIATPLIAIAVAWLAFKQQRFGTPLRSPLLQNIHALLKSGWGFDFIYHRLFVVPFNWLCQLNRRDIIDQFYAQLEAFARAMHQFTTNFQNGRLRSYNTSLILFCVLAIGWGLIR